MELSMISELRLAIERFQGEFPDEDELRSQLGIQGANIVLCLRDAAQRALHDLAAESQCLLGALEADR